MQFLKQSTAASILVGPVLDSAGASYTSAVIGDFNITKNGTSAAMAAAATATHDHNGMYVIALTTGNTDTLGRVDISLNKSTYAMSVFRYEVLTASTFDAIVTNAATAAGGLCDTIRVNGQLWSAAGTVTLPSTVASTTNITGGIITTVTNLTNLPTMPTDWVTAAGLKADAVTEIQSGLSTFNVGTDTVSANITKINSSTLAATKLGAVYDAFENGTAQAGGASSITLANTASSVDDFFKNQVVFLLGGTGAKQTNKITGYNGTTKVATVETPWVTVPDNTTPYFILGRIG